MARTKKPVYGKKELDVIAKVFLSFAAKECDIERALNLTAAELTKDRTLLKQHLKPAIETAYVMLDDIMGAKLAIENILEPLPAEHRDIVLRFVNEALAPKKLKKAPIKKAPKAKPTNG